MSSVRLSVCPSVTLVDQDHISWKSWKLIARTISPTPSLFVAQKPPTYSHGEIWGRLEVWWEKVACWSTKAAISLKREKIEETHYRELYKHTIHTNAVSKCTIPDRLRPHLPQDWGFATLPQNCNRYIYRTGKATNFKFGTHIHRVHANKSPLKLGRKGSVGVSRDCPIFWVPPIISATGKAIWTSNFVCTFLVMIGTKARYKFREK